MGIRLTTAFGVAAAALIWAAPARLIAQDRQAGTKATGWSGRAADGHPDLQGTWNYSTITPFERPAGLGNKAVFTDEEAAAFERQTAASSDRDRRDEEAGRGQLVNGTIETADLARAYNEFWWDRGTKVVGTKRTSLVVDPPDGRVPALTPEAAKRAADRYAILQRPAYGPEDRPMGERCIHQQRTGPPINAGGYNNNLLLVQTAGQVTILTEQIHEARVIPLDGRPHVNQSIRQWKGDSRGRWEGNTLVVETTNFNGQTAYRDSGEQMHLVERFTRLDQDSLLYEYTVTDPASFVRPWTVQMTMTRTTDPMYEYACHEGNYGIVGSLSGARAVERAAATAAKKGSR